MAAEVILLGVVSAVAFVALWLALPRSDRNDPPPEHEDW